MATELDAPIDDGARAFPSDAGQAAQLTRTPQVELRARRVGIERRERRRTRPIRERTRRNAHTPGEGPIESRPARWLCGDVLGADDRSPVRAHTGAREHCDQPQRGTSRDEPSATASHAECCRALLASIASAAVSAAVSAGR